MLMKWLSMGAGHATNTNQMIRGALCPEIPALPPGGESSWKLSPTTWPVISSVVSLKPQYSAPVSSLVDSTLQYTGRVFFLEHDRIFPSGTLTDLTLYFSPFVSLCYSSIAGISIGFSCILLVILVNHQTWGCSENLWACRQLVRSGGGLGTLQLVADTWGEDRLVEDHALNLWSSA